MEATQAPDHYPVPVERLSGLDSAFLSFETPTMHMHVAGVVIIDPSGMPGGYSFERIRAHVIERSPLIDGMRRRLAQVPFRVAHPYWVEDPSFDIDYHVRRVGLPAPGSQKELAECIGAIASMPLNRSRPLWEMHVIEGLADGSVAICVKMHHATVDGVSGANLMFHMFDLERDAPSREIPPDSWAPERPPGELGLFVRGLRDLVGWPVGLARLAPDTFLRVANLLLSRLHGSGPGMAVPFTAPRTSFNATVTAHRSVAFGQVPLEDVKRVKAAFGVKVNDVVLAVCAGALRRYLADGEELPDRPLMAAVPVSVHDATPERDGVNKVSAMLATLATDVPDAVERLRVIAAANEGAKREHNLVGAATLQQWAEYAAPNTFSLAARVYSSLRFADRHPVVHNVIISNVPGPPIPLYFAGARITGLYPLGPVMDGAGLNITVLSLEDTVGFGIIACKELVPEPELLVDRAREALAELVAAAEGAGSSGGRRRASGGASP
jgi:WS/DGAT/MGAT family acyltransferase